ncbi:probable asparagine synthetase [glutamine-hydrolyzing] isoform X2 [Bradysia coprophila]|uniref:probable asparagine synthetase [glutamine-hydrolyzing] isoform X1 n=1 Tax=Bradysia coprophila TaxID=38358 RepID=UPI00187DA8DB|nr:probable asparagine synthetase [glutamine-hydrolyzing] isoform X1 [Bradysia coprophila]XP_037032180.1 probable asparagine synthetase [glutamine-hydrolyzing] isoform X2 [Bradysia coprophila]
MCGILAVFSKSTGEIRISKKYGKRLKTLRELAYRQSSCQRHRGPDHTGVTDWSDHGVVFVQERLRILGVEFGDQPFVSENGNVLLVCNGEIYNYLELSEVLAKRRGKYVPRSDSDIVLGLYEEFGTDILHMMTGMFGFALYDRTTRQIFVARDPIGIIPLYRGYDDEGNLWVCSEMKCLVDVCDKVEVFPPGTSLHGTIDNLKEERFYQPKWITEIPSTPADITSLREHLVAAVRSHLQCDVKLGALLSGGVDSSIIASVATKIMRERDPNYRLKTFSVGLENAPDFKYSRMVADYINSDHEEIVFKVEDGLDCIRDIIFHCETYDVTTVRCSIPMVLMARAIKSGGIKMILSGEGADEIFGGYLYFFNAPNHSEFHFELVKRVLALHYSDCLRANKAAMSWGIELRVPFLDTNFVNHAMDIAPQDKIPIAKRPLNGCTPRIEKQILRAAFSDNFLPDEVIWRQKEQFSDGVGYNWIDTIRQFASDRVSDADFANAAVTYPINTPSTKEAYYYRSIFEEIFPGDGYARTVMRWIPRADWGCPEDPSGRAQKVHSSTTQEE